MHLKIFINRFRCLVRERATPGGRRCGARAERVAICLHRSEHSAGNRGACHNSHYHPDTGISYSYHVLYSGMEGFCN